MLSLSLFLLIFPIIQSCKSPTAPKVSAPDTTSSNFTWTIDTLGSEGSMLYDVSIINDTLAYAVGMLYNRDSTGKSDLSNLYNAAVWNGKTWTKLKVPYNYQGTLIYNPIHTVFVLNSTDIYFGGNGLEHWDGKKFSNIDAVNQFWTGRLMQKIWASSDNNIYIVGDGGTIVYYNGNWQNIECNTNLPFQDIWGGTDRLGRQQVLAVASDKFGNGGKAIISIDSGEATTISDSGYISSLSGVWFMANQIYYVVGPGIFQRNFIQDNEGWSGPALPLDWYTFAIRGNDKNDVIVVGEAGSVSHFNGVSWVGYTQLLNPIDRLVSVSMKNNLVIAVGNRNYDGVHYYGLVYIGKR